MIKIERKDRFGITKQTTIIQDMPLKAVEPLHINDEHYMSVIEIEPHLLCESPYYAGSLEISFTE